MRMDILQFYDFTRFPMKKQIFTMFDLLSSLDEKIYQNLRWILRPKLNTLLDLRF